MFFLRTLVKAPSFPLVIIWLLLVSFAYLTLPPRTITSGKTAVTHIKSIYLLKKSALSKHPGNVKITSQKMQQMWLLLDSEKDSKQRQILKKVICLPTISTANGNEIANILCGLPHWRHADIGTEAINTVTVKFFGMSPAPAPQAPQLC